MKPFRFGVRLQWQGNHGEWISRVRLAEALGYDVIVHIDILAGASPLPVLVSAAEATDRIRVGPMILNVGFWHPRLLARELATADQLTGGRLEIGLGTGRVHTAGAMNDLATPSPQDRVARLERTLQTLARLFEDPQTEPRPLQRPRPPLMVAGAGDRIVRLAARYADMFDLERPPIMPADAPAGVSPLIDVDTAAERYSLLRAAAGDRAPAIELSIVAQCIITRDRHGVATDLRASTAPYLSTDQILASPKALIGSVDQVTEQLLGHRERLGVSYIVVREPALRDFAPVIDRLVGR